MNILLGNTGQISMEYQLKEAGDLGTFPEGVLASWTRHVTRSPMQDALLLSARPGIICFSLGLPSPELFPLKRFTNACAEVLARGPGALQYGPPSQELKAHVVSLMRIRGVDCTEQQVFLTTGAQQALHLIVSLLLDEGRQVLAEELCYPGFQQVIKFYNPEILTVPTDPKSGMDINKVEWYLAHGARPAFIYTIPDGHNPWGVSLSEEKRIGLLTLSRRYGIPIIEEDPYGFLSYGPNPTKPMRAHRGDLVFYIGSFSKILAPSMRLGWLIVPEKLTPHLAILKESFDIDTTTLSQHIVACMLDSSFIAEHLDRLRSEYKLRRDTMLAALSNKFPHGSAWDTPDSGVFVWVRLPEGLDTTALLQTAVTNYGVAFMPGSVFCVTRDGGSARSSVRMNFSHPSPARIEEGVLRLGEMFGCAGSLIAARSH
jgi:2-aminoadipate transaminase